jgi:hypothetical protein
MMMRMGRRLVCVGLALDAVQVSPFVLTGGAALIVDVFLVLIGLLHANRGRPRVEPLFQRLALERVAGRRAIPPERFIGWRDAANRSAVGAL